MINLDDMEKDPWPTWPVRKDDLRKLASALQAFEEDNRKLAGMLQEAIDELRKLSQENHHLRMMNNFNIGGKQ